MTSVAPISSYSFQGGDGRSKTEQIATGVGAAGAAAATNKAVKRGVFSAVSSKASELEKFTTLTQDSLVLASKSASKMQKLGALFRTKKAAYMADYAKLVTRFEKAGFIGKIIKSPITKKASSALGGAMAFFVLVPAIFNIFQTFGNIVEKYA